MKCPRCKTSRLMEIVTTVGDQEVTMRSCSRCDSRWWDRDGEPVALPEVLELASKKR